MVIILSSKSHKFHTQRVKIINMISKKEKGHHYKECISTQHIQSETEIPSQSTYKSMLQRKEITLKQI